MKFYLRNFLFVLLFLSVFTLPAISQTITVTNFDNSIIYSPGSSIGVPITISNTAGNCIGQNNTFSLFLSNAAGVYPATPIATYVGFYATYINATIPTLIPIGTGYKVKVTSSSNPGATIVESAPFTIAVGPAIKAGIEPTNSLPIVNDAIYGSCNSPQGTFRFDYQSTSTTGTTGTVKVIDELNAGTPTDIPTLAGTFTSTKQSNFTAVVRAGNGLVNGTKAYTLLNNTVFNNIGSSGATSACLPATNASASLTYKVDVSILQNNYPGNIYRVTWGDGTAASDYTICDLIASGGFISHSFTKSSCGNNPAPGQNNKFEVKIQPVSPYCGNIGTVALTYATISNIPVNRITAPAPIYCSGSVTFLNGSYPGEDINSTTGICQPYPNAKYTWFVDGVSKLFNTGLNNPFTTTLTSGHHTIRLVLLQGNGLCTAEDATYDICIQDPPKPSFTVPTTNVCSATGVAITNTSIIDQTCTPPVYNWTVTGPAGSTVTPTGGTTFNSFEPKFIFSGAGVYTIRLSMPNACNGTVQATPLTLNVDASPTVSLPATADYCGPQTLTFNSTNGSATRVVYTGSAGTGTPTYNWTVTPSAGAGAASFINGTSAASQFPQISFPGFGTYTVTIAYTNACGTVTATETINVQQAPVVSAGSNAPVCASSGNFSPTGTIDDMTKVVSYQWRTNGDGTFTNGTTSLTPTYNLGTNDKRGGNIILTLDVKTNLVGACSTVQSSMTLSVTPIAVVTSAASKGICSGSGVGYNITSNAVGTTYAWTATGSANVTGFSGGGTAATLMDVLVNSDPTTNGTVTYTITPTANGCVGTPFTFTVTVYPLPVLTLSDITSLCSGWSAGIVLDPSLKYTYTSIVASGTANGNKQQATPINTAGINDILNNTGTTQAVVRYTITPISANGCPGMPVDVTVTIEPLPTQPVFNPAAIAICDAASYQLSATNPIVGTGLWTEATGKTVSFADATNPATIVSGLVPGTIYNFKWTISTSCASNSATLQVTDNLASVGGTTSAATTTVCYNSSGTITLTGNVGNVIAWQLSTDGGVNWQTIGGTNTNTSYNYTNLIQTTSFRAVVVNGNCTLANSTQTTITVNPATVIPNAGIDQTLCNETTAVLTGNSPGASSGIWTQKSGPTAGISLADATSPTTTVNGLTGGNNYTFTWTILGQPPCGNLSDDMVITDQSLMTNTITNPGNNTICAGSSITVNGSVPTGGVAPYTYAWESSTDNGVTWAFISGQTSQNLTASPLATTQYRRTVFSNQKTCSVVSNVVTISTQAALANNSISNTSPTVCYNTAPAIITGSTPTGGDGIYFYRWQQSTDGVNFTDIPLATAKDYQPGVLTVTTVFRRFVSTTLCNGVLGSQSNLVTIATTPQLIAKFTANQTNGCAPFNITSANVQATPDNNAQTYSWFANNAPIGSGLVFPGYIIAGEGAKVTIKLVVSSKIGCPDESFSMDFTTSLQATASFTMDKIQGCGPQTVNFVNTSTPLNSSTYLWTFSDGTTFKGVTPPPHVFQPNAQGRDQQYTVTLTAEGCAPNTTPAQFITVYPAKPMPIIDPGPLNGCSPYPITVKNITLGTNTKYEYFLYDGTTQLQKITLFDKSDAVFNPVGSTTIVKTFDVYMIATGPCGDTTKSVVFPITTTPSGITARMNVTPLNSSGNVEGCAPFLATFHNLSTGGNQYFYNVYDSNFTPIVSFPASGASTNYTFPTAGTYYVDISVVSSCNPRGVVSTPQIKIVVDPLPAPDFTADLTKGCTQLAVKFTNTTPGTPNSPAVSNTYTWDFGDGTTSNAFSPNHTYAYKSTPYTVTLTAVNSSGCSAIVTKFDFINVYPPPQTNFTASPDTITSIPNYTFKFLDNSKVDGVSWFWDFGDHTTSTLRNPSHTYADTGAYRVTLVTYTQFGCTDSKTHVVRITGVPGQLYVPNAFMPTSLTPELQTFTVKGSGLKTWTMRIFNIWGQMVFETTKLNGKGEPVEFWDGRFKGQDSQQGAYAWEISATFINGTDWKGMSYKGGAPKKAGTLNLIR